MNFLNLIIVTIFLLAISITFSLYKNSYYKKVMFELVQKNDADKYIKMLNSTKAKFLLGKKTRYILLVDGYISLKNYEEVYSLFKTLRNLKLSYGKKINLYQKEISVYLEQKKCNEAISSYEDLKLEGEKINDPHMNKILQDSEMVINVYAKNNPEYLNTLLDLEKNEVDKSKKGIYDYRIAVCYSKMNDDTKAKTYLKKAKENLDGTFVYNLVNKVVKNPELITDYIL